MELPGNVCGLEGEHVAQAPRTRAYLSNLTSLVSPGFACACQPNVSDIAMEVLAFYRVTLLNGISTKVCLTFFFYIKLLFMVTL